MIYRLSINTQSPKRVEGWHDEVTLNSELGRREAREEEDSPLTVFHAERAK